MAKQKTEEASEIAIKRKAIAETCGAAAGMTKQVADMKIAGESLRDRCKLVLDNGALVKLSAKHRDLLATIVTTMEDQRETLDAVLEIVSAVDVSINTFKKEFAE